MTIRSATGQGRTGQGSLAVLNILKRVAQLIARLIYMSHTHTHTRTLSLSLSLSVGSMCHAPHSTQSINPTMKKVHSHTVSCLHFGSVPRGGSVAGHTHTQHTVCASFWSVCVEVNSWSIYGQIFSPVIAIILSHISPYILVFLPKLLSVSRGFISFSNWVKIAENPKLSNDD